MIEFNQIPSDVRVPLAYIEFDNTRAQNALAANDYTILAIGQRLSAGTVAAGVPTIVSSAADAATYFGAGSMLAEIFAALKTANRYTKTVAIALDDAVGAIAATGTLALTGTATAAGSLSLTVDGVTVRSAVADGDTAAAAATAFAASVNALTSLPVSAAAATGTVTLTAKNKGATGAKIVLIKNFNAGDATPAGLGATLTGMSGGATNPDISTAIAAMADDWYQAIVMPYTDSANMTALSTELASRYGPTRQIDGIAYLGYNGPYSTVDTFGATLDDPHMSVMGNTNGAPQASWQWAAAITGVAAASLAIDPARPLQTLTLPGILAPSLGSRFTWDERNVLLHDGVSTFSVAADGTVAIERLITTYQKNGAGVDDASYLDVNTLATLSYLRYATRAAITSKFPRCKLASDGTPFGPGQAIVTPSIARAELIALAQDFIAAGLIEDLDQFKADLVVEIDPNDPNRLNVLSSPNLVNQLRIFADQIQFIV